MKNEFEPKIITNEIPSFESEKSIEELLDIIPNGPVRDRLADSYYNDENIDENKLREELQKIIQGRKRVESGLPNDMGNNQLEQKSSA